MREDTKFRAYFRTSAGQKARLTAVVWHGWLVFRYAKYDEGSGRYAYNLLAECPLRVILRFGKWLATKQ